MTSQFSFLQQEYLELYKLSELAEKLYFIDPSSSIAKLRLFSEKLAILHKAFKDELIQLLDSVQGSFTSDTDALQCSTKQRVKATKKSPTKTLKPYAERDEVLGMVAEE
ncbi:MAG: hypothetical protein QM535_05495 [Limnohabitans sp.]|nr:hypothetical protein [Limnohabitans sp.]